MFGLNYTDVPKLESVWAICYSTNVWLIIMRILLKHVTNDHCVKCLCIFQLVHTQAHKHTFGQNYLKLFKGALSYLWLCVFRNWLHDYVINWLHLIPLKHNIYIHLQTS